MDTREGSGMAGVLEQLVSLLGADSVVHGAEAVEQAVGAWGRLGEPLAIVRPRTVEQVSAVLRLAHSTGASVVTWGGRTGLVDGARADGAIALSLERLNRIESVDAQAATMTVEAGCILANACDAAEAEGLFLPLDLGARGSATIGGTISTNAGGNRVVRFGMMRDMVLGLEVVLADGTVVSSLNRLIKNNTGYDLKSLFIGSEGTLGVVVKAVLRLRPRPRSQDTAYVAVERFENLPRLLRLLESELGGGLSAFEVMWPEYYELVTTPPALGRPPLPHGHPFYVLVESLGADAARDAERFEAALGKALEDGIAVDAAVAKSQAERDRMWALRDDVRQTGRYGPVVSFDVSLPIADMESYVDELRARMSERWPQSRLIVFGHLGDGNLHVIASIGDPKARHDVEDLVYGALAARGGSISAEHGIGLQKLDYLALCRNPQELALMRALKTTLDPRNVLNPGKILPLQA